MIYLMIDFYDYKLKRYFAYDTDKPYKIIHDLLDNYGFISICGNCYTNTNYSVYDKEFIDSVINSLKEMCWFVDSCKSLNILSNPRVYDALNCLRSKSINLMEFVYDRKEVCNE